MFEYGAWREYAEQQLVQATAKAATLREYYQYAWDQAYQRCGHGTETAKKRELGADEQLANLRFKVLQAEVYRDMLSGRVDSYNNAIAIISREITRRGFTLEQK